MKKYVLYVIIGLMFFGTGCTKKWLDVNTDPNNPSKADAELVLPAGIVSVCATIGGYYTLHGGFWSQYWTQSNAANQYKDIDAFNIASSNVDPMWNEIYAGGLNDLQYVIDSAKVQGNDPMLMIATVMKAYTFAFLVDYHGDIPYFDAFKGTQGNANPKYDAGKDIYLDIFKQLDSVKALDFSIVTPSVANADLIFGGHMDKWIQFANTIELRMYLRMSYADAAAAQTGVEALYAAGANFLTEDAKLDIFIDAENKDNPLYASNNRKLNVATNLRVSTTIYRYFEQNADPRLDNILEDNSKTDPLPQGGSSIPQTQLDKDDIPVYLLSPTDPVYLISNVESMLLQAEAVMRGWGTGDDKALYEAAIEADFARRGAGSSAGFVGVGDAYEYPAAGTDEEKLEAIIMAKWAAFAGNQTSEAFFEFNRTHYPAISTEPAWSAGAYNPAYIGGFFTYPLSGTTSGEFAHRMIYPQSEVDYNTNFPGQTKITDKTWWNTK